LLDVSGDEAIEGVSFSGFMGTRGAGERPDRIAG
jgi:hypothetical protein